MTTKHRDALPGIHHVWVNATGNEPYFADEIDRMTWIRDLVTVAAKHELTCLAFCQMTTHTHLLLDVRGNALSGAMQRLNCTYGRRFNIRHDRRGQLLRRRYGSRRVDGARDLLGAFAYVVLNPVKAQIVPRAEDWRWSSCATTLGLTEDYPFVDASLVLAEAGGATSLRSIVDARWREYLSLTDPSGRQTTGRGSWGQVRP